MSAAPATLRAARSERAPSDIPFADRLRAKDLAALEKCSAYTAGQLIRSGKLGKVYGRNRRDRWIDRQAYRAWLDLPANPAPNAATGSAGEAAAGVLGTNTARRARRANAA